MTLKNFNQDKICQNCIVHPEDYIQEQQNYCFTFDKSTTFKAEVLYEKCPEDWLQTDVFIKSANAIYNSVYAKPFKNRKVYFHRGSPYMKAVYDNKKRAAFPTSF